ncbi:30S ribosomal protein S8 [Mesomycoplasma ovipneumoniae]|uniref:Small ribosomal subunit protein uS8 n=1 Tax=Mesomycoplasma ovipneumoniae TaxID=29562 RepID=A0AAJ2P9C5_9BACT|nr:30S ribosomal protein S8 [Mesomycoplasma ovipneumoniae]MCN0157704.1 30S ribosomal protein S8 [Mesomycoplasma ovipneumoniae]MDO6826151.1 30S ribosomal protein S8 [Mesomycoplasma ovipneumoniae]MDO6829893.1 30S ribosomal protein S8 [Mesomycoplasma ovipneumoniae]MDW2834341.1 30S ribosomal protein S8 [Mesomycoplasma ovipneumoniae]MDW2835101.1 30S ribosomal protein S8 [Mesomycoplasma ovipneumoniae]
MAFITDPIADMLTRIRNATIRKHKQVSFQHSKIKAKMLEIIKEAGYIKDFQIEGELKKTITVELKYKGTTSSISGLKRISKPSLRVYAPAQKIPFVQSGYGIAILSTSKGLLTDSQARKENVGGEIIAYIW